MSLNKGELTRQVTIEQLTESAGSSKFPVKNWSTLIASAWMSKEEQRDNERYIANQLTASLITIWTMPYVASMDPDLVDVPKTRRLIYQGRTFVITAASHIGRKDRIELTTLAASKVA